MEVWKFFSDTKGKPQYKIYIEDRIILSNILKLSGAKPSATYSNGQLRPIGWDVIIPANRLKAVFRLTGLKQGKIKFI